MADFQKLYVELLKYAKAISSSHAEIEPGDLVNDAYLELYQKESATLQDYKNKIKGLLYRDTIHAKSGSNNETQHTCKKCHETKPVGAFRCESYKGSNIKNKIRNICRACEVAYIILHSKVYPEIRRKYEEKEESKKKNAKRVREFVQNNRDKWNAYARERYKLYGRKDRLPK